MLTWNMTEIGSGADAPTGKHATILKAFLEGRSLNRFEAEALHDHCLNSTVSALQNNFGIVIDRHREKVPCVNGKASTSVNRYRLNAKPANVKRARDTLALMTKQRASK
ncbi:MAG: hypothetical protein E6Q48_05485 [Limnohabitans sp.]|nr:MAG: hypothetical protein E6Q48_05485 [Limnohabitans sp.]